MSAPKRPVGRPSTYTEEWAREICARLANGESISKICRDDDMPGLSTVYEWLDARKEFADRYARAREDQAHYYAAEIIEIADNSGLDVTIGPDGKITINNESVARARLMTDARKWYASKLAPKHYAEKSLNEVTGADGGAIQTADVTIDVARKLAFAMAKGARLLPKPGEDKP